MDKKKAVVVTSPDDLGTLKIIYYGEPGVGKTRLAAQAQDVKELQKILLISIEMGSLSIRHRKNLDVVTIGDDKELAQAIKILQGNPDYKTVIIDSLTRLHKCLMRPLMKRVVATNPKMDTVEVPSMREWGIISERMQLLLIRASHQGYNVIATATERTDRDETIGLPYARMDLPGRLPNHIMEWADIVGRLVATTKDERTERTAYFQPGRRWAAKDRSGSLGTSLVVKEEIPGNPETSTFCDMYNMIFNEGGE